MLGRTLAHYKILEKIGSGGMGDVYAAEDTKLERKVALKVLPPELAERGRVRFEQEAKAIAALDHPNIVQVFSLAGAHEAYCRSLTCPYPGAHPNGRGMERSWRCRCNKPATASSSCCRSRPWKRTVS